MGEDFERLYDVIVVGAGIVGLTTTLELHRCCPHLRLLLVDKESDVGLHQTGHNSGVIHSGIYYRPGSLKAELCLRGRRLLMDFADQHQIPYEVTGKVIVAIKSEELPRLHALHRQAHENGIDNTRLIGPEELREREPHAVGIEALHVPSTGIIDYGAVARQVRNLLLERGVGFRASTEISGIREDATHVTVSIRDSKRTLRAKHVLVTAGLSGDRLARSAGHDPRPEIIPFRGDYLMLRPERRHWVRHLIYPVPDPSLPFLGVHFTRRLDGEIWIGPNAVLALAREGYRKTDVNLRDVVETLVYPGLWRLLARYPATAVSEMAGDAFTRLYLRGARRYLPELRRQDVLPGPSGVRAQTLEANGTLTDDFVVTRGRRTLGVRNAPSPAATSSFAIAEYLVHLATRTLGL